MNTNEQLSSAITGEMITAYQNASLLGLFKGVNIGDIGVENWFHKNMEDIPDAALSLAGFNPSDAKLDASLFSHKVLTSAERLRIGQKEWKQFEKWGINTQGIAKIGEKVGELASYYLFRGEDMDGNTPSGDGNYIIATGDGSLGSPSVISSALSGGWGTYANKVFDCYGIIGNLVGAGHNVGSTVIYYPKSAYQAMHKAAADEKSAMELLTEQGVLGIVPIDDVYLYTLAGATPVNALFDLYAVDLNMIEIGYTMEESTNVIEPHHEIRDTIAECEVWFCPYMVPMPKDSAITKGVSRITAITQA